DFVADHELTAVDDERLASQHTLLLEEGSRTVVEGAAGGVGAGEHRRRRPGAAVAPPVAHEGVVRRGRGVAADDLAGGVVVLERGVDVVSPVGGDGSPLTLVALAAVIDEPGEGAVV